MKKNNNKEQKETMNLEDVKLPPGARKMNLGDIYKQFPIENIESTQKEIKKLTENEFILTSIILSIQLGIAQETPIMAMAEMIRKGGANKNTPLEFTMNIVCPQEKTTVKVTKEQIQSSLQMATTKNRRTMRDLANYMALDIIQMGLDTLISHPERDFSGDLARKIHTRLIYRKEPPLTKKERIGCASYAQNIENLNQLTDSDRLISLLAEDLQIRRANTQRKPKKKIKRSNPI